MDRYGALRALSRGKRAIRAYDAALMRPRRGARRVRLPAANGRRRIRFGEQFPARSPIQSERAEDSRRFAGTASRVAAKAEGYGIPGPPQFRT